MADDWENADKEIDNKFKDEDKPEEKKAIKVSP